MNKPLKIAIYAICKNEKQFLNNWITSVLEADYVCVLDTGSTDGTYELLLEWQKMFPNKIIINQKTYSPWRFDTPRNDSMSFVPEDADVLWSIDLDELPVKGWSDLIRQSWTPDTDRGIYLYAWSHDENGEPLYNFWYDKMHRRHDFQWRFPVHESVLLTDKTKKEKLTPISHNTLLHHWPDFSKSRNSYLDLIRLRVSENSNDMYGKIYLMRELQSRGEYQECIDLILQQIIPNVTNPNPKELIDLMFMPSAYCCLGDCYASIGDSGRAYLSYKLGIASFPTHRDCYIGLAALVLDKNPLECKETLLEMFEKTTRFYSWLERDISWGGMPYDMLSRAYMLLGNVTLASDYALLASTLTPTPFFQENYRQISEIKKNVNLTFQGDTNEKA
jgi:hypothetical protein